MKEEDVNIPNKQITKTLAEEVVKLWTENRNLPTIGLNAVQKQIEGIYTKAEDI